MNPNGAITRRTWSLCHSAAPWKKKRCERGRIGFYWKCAAVVCRCDDVGGVLRFVRVCLGEGERADEVEEEEVKSEEVAVYSYCIEHTTHQTHKTSPHSHTLCHSNWHDWRALTTFFIPPHGCFPFPSSNLYACILRVNTVCHACAPDRIHFKMAPHHPPFALLLLFCVTTHTHTHTIDACAQLE